jgi:hypothetical protein
MCHELRLLENGREDRTPVRADLQGGSPFGVPREMNLSVNSVAEFSLGDTNVINRQRSQESRYSTLTLHLTTSRSSEEATAEPDDRLLLESLILAQDERWRRA